MGLLRNIATRRLWRRFALLLIAGGLLGAAAPVSEYQLKAVFLFNFAQFVEWPSAALPREIELPTLVEDGRSDGENAAIGPLCSRGH